MAPKRTSAATQSQKKKNAPARSTVTLPAFPVPHILDALRSTWGKGCPTIEKPKGLFRKPRTVWLDRITGGATLAAVTGRANRDARLRDAALAALAAEGHAVRLDVTDDGAAASLDTLNKTHHGNTAGVDGYLVEAVRAVLDAGTTDDKGKPKPWTAADRRKVEAWLDTVSELFRTAPGENGGPSTRPRLMYVTDGARVEVVALAPDGYDPLPSTPTP